MDQPARSVTFAEAGRIGLIEEVNVLYHFEGLLRLLHSLGMTESAPAKQPEAVIITRYHWIPGPVDGFYRYHLEPGQKVAKAR